MLKLRINDSPGIVNLSDPINTDWIVWGADGSTLAATRETGANLISDVTPVGGATIGEDLFSFVQFTWTGGTPIASEMNDTPEVSASGSANIGFQITVPASTNIQTLNIYAGIYGSAELDASISDGSSPNITDTSVTSLGEADKTYSIDFRAGSTGQTLTIQLKLTDANGYADLQAATLQPHLPEVTVTSPVDGQTFSSGSNIPASVNVNQYDNAISLVQIDSNGGQLFDMTTPPYSATWSGAAPGHYQLQGTAIDSNQLIGASQPIAIDVVGSGGTLTESLGQFTGTVDLTSEGDVDWRMFAPGDVKTGVPTLISDYTELGNHLNFPQPFCGGPDLFSFEDGTPDLNESNSNACIFEDGLGNGFQFTVIADTTPRTLRVYLGADYGVAKLQAYLSDGSAAPILDSSLNNQDAATDTVYTINFSSASAGQRLTVRFTLEQQYDWGDLTLYAATLNGSAYAEAPTVSSVSPSSGAPGTLVTIRGTNFGATQGASLVTLNRAPVAPTSWSSTRITFNIPSTATSGNVVVTVGGIATGGVNFNVLPTPTIISLSQTEGVAGTPITITGTNFGSFQGASTVKFNGTTATPTHWSATSIVVPIPAGATSGNVVVHASGVDTNGLNFNVVTVTAITVTPQNLSLPLNSVQRFNATATLSDGTMQNVSSNATWTSSTTTAATIDATGVLAATGQGQTTVQAVFGGASGSTTLTLSGNSFVAVGSLNFARFGYTATLLPSGKVLIVGGGGIIGTLSSAELYDPITRTFSMTGSLNNPRMYHTATLLQNGTVLIQGGEYYTSDGNGPFSPSSDELYDPETGSFTQLASDIAISFNTATLLNDDNILISGSAQPELYNTASATYTNINPPGYAASSGQATALLNDGTVLITGGFNNPIVVANAEIYDPVAGTMSPTSNLTVPRDEHSATVLDSGKVLIAGGASALRGATLFTTETYDPVSKTFAPSASMAMARADQTATLLADGTVLIVGGDTSNPEGTDTAELFDPTTQIFIGAGSTVVGRSGQTATLLQDGTVLLVGGDGGNNGTAEIYGAPPPPPTSLQITPATLTLHLGQTQKFIVKDQDGLQRFEATWTVSDPTLASLSAESSPTLTPTAYGELTVTATIDGVSAQAQVIIAPLSLQVTPSTVNMQVGDSREFTVVDNLGRPSTPVIWSVSDTSLASITTDNQPTLTALNPGTVTVTANIEGVTAQAQVTISPIGVLLPGSVLWSNPPVPGFTATQIAQAVPTDGSPDLYSIQTSMDGSQSVIQALTADGQQMWQQSLPIVNGNSVPDGNGGLIVTENNTCYPNQANPMSIVDLDPATGDSSTLVTAAGVMGPSGPIYCYPDTIKAMEPQIAVRGDGSIIISAMTNNGLPPLTIANPQHGLPAQMNLPTSTDTHPDGTTFAEFSPMGPPMVNSDGNAYLEYEVRDIAYPPKITSAVLYLLQIASDNSTTTMTLSSTTQDENLMPGRIIPDGNGGVLATWTVSPSTGPVPQFPYQAVDVVGGSVGTPYNLPFSPPSTTAGDYPTLVLGESGVAFATGATTTTDGTNQPVSQLASFNIADGSPNWTYQAPVGDTVTMISSTDSNGVVTKQTQNGTDTVIRFDSAGIPTTDSWSGTGVDYYIGNLWTATVPNSSVAVYSAAPIQFSDAVWTAPDQDGSSQANQVTTITGFSTTGPNQTAITSVYQKILAALPSNSTCNSWMQGSGDTEGETGTQFINGMIGATLFGHGSFDSNHINVAAITGIDKSVVGVPQTGVLTVVNDNGGFFNQTAPDGSTFVWGPPQYPGNTIRNQAATLIHEAGHGMNIAGFLHDGSGTRKKRAEAGKANDKMVYQNCKSLIEGLQ